MKNDNLRYLQIDSILVEGRARKEFDKKEMEQLVESIKMKGVLQPITVKEIDGSYKLQSGERRIRASLEVGLKEIPCLVRQMQEDDELDDMEVELYENFHRSNLNWKESLLLKEKIFNYMIEKYGTKLKGEEKQAEGMNIERVAELMGEDRGNFSKDLKLAKVVREHPALFREAKNRSEAHRVVKAVEKHYAHHQATKKAEEQEKKIIEKKSEGKEVTESDKAFMMRNTVAGWFKVGNCEEELPKIGSGIADLFSIDPPYAIEIDKVKKKADKAVDGLDEYSEMSSEEYRRIIPFVVKEAYRILKPNGWMIVWFGPDPWFEELYQWCIEAGFEGRRLCGEWIKKTGQTNVQHMYLANATEWFFYFRKGQASLHIEGHTNTYHFDPVPQSKKIHRTEKPIEMMESIFDTFLYPGARIVVPFLGSGNDILAAANLKMRAFGWDLSEKHKEGFVTRALADDPGRYRSYIK